MKTLRAGCASLLLAIGCGPGTPAPADSSLDVARDAVSDAVLAELAALPDHVVPSDALLVDAPAALDATDVTDVLTPDAPALDVPAPDAAVDAASEGGALGACVCTRTLAVTDSTVDLSALAPGSVVCLRGTAPYGPLTLQGFHGTAASPIVVRNCDGPVQIHSSDSRFALSLNGDYFRVTGAGAAGTSYGIALTSPMAAVVVALGHATHFELDHLDVSNSNYAGVMAKVDPGTASCMQFDRRYDPFMMVGVSFHHNHLHDLPNGEGLYLGDSFYGGTNNQFCGATPGCDLTPCGGMQYPHVVRNVRVYSNLTENTGREGLQVGAADSDCVIADNVVRNFGLAGLSSQNYGIQVGVGSACEVSRNLVETGPIGMNLQGIGGTRVANNVIHDVGAGVQINPRPTPLAGDIVNQTYVGGFELVNNTIVANGTAGLLVDDINPPNAVPTAGNVFQGNLLVAGATAYTRLTARYNWTSAVNLHYASVAAAGLGSDWCLAAGAPGVDAAPDATSLGVTGDYRAMPRPLGAGWDVGALECR